MRFDHTHPGTAAIVGVVGIAKRPWIRQSQPRAERVADVIHALMLDDVAMHPGDGVVRDLR